MTLSVLPLDAPAAAATTPVPRRAAGAHRSSLLHRAYSEYCRQAEAGAAPDPSQFCACYPAIQNSLARLLSVHQRVHEDDHFLDAPEVSWPRAGDTFLGFELERELGRGAFSRVFLAHEPALGSRRVVVKLSPGGAAEALTLGRLGHANIVPVYSVVVDERSGIAAVCMPYLGAATVSDLLDRVLAGTALPRDAVVILDAAAKGQPLVEAAPGAAAVLRRAGYAAGIRHLAGQLLDALAFMHTEGVCHRDLKPSNILLTDAGVPMLLDFNLSWDARRADGRFGGTPGYMSPEQLRLMGERHGTPAGLDSRSDLFSLGVILYELLTGEHPFGPLLPGTPQADLQRMLAARHTAGARPVRALNPAVDRALAARVDRCLAFPRVHLSSGLRPHSKRARCWRRRARCSGAVAVWRGSMYCWSPAWAAAIST